MRLPKGIVPPERDYFRETRLLTLRFGALTADAESHIRAASVAELDDVGERLLSADTLVQALGQRT